MKENKEPTMHIEETWKETQTEIFQKAKFLKQGTSVRVVAATLPKEVTIEGKYGKRPMYIIETMEYGLVYVSPLQMAKIVEYLESNNFKTPTTVIL